jgi:hypothetical protein
MTFGPQITTLTTEKTWLLFHWRTDIEGELKCTLSVFQLLLFIRFVSCKLKSVVFNFPYFNGVSSQYYIVHTEKYSP